MELAEGVLKLACQAQYGWLPAIPRERPWGPALLALAAGGVDGQAPVLPGEDRVLLEQWGFLQWEAAAWDPDPRAVPDNLDTLVADHSRIFRHLMNLSHRLEGVVKAGEATEMDIEERAAEVFGSGEAARTWLHSPAWGLGGRVPEDYMNEFGEAGAREVTDLLGRIEAGVTS
ncbi:antitoxin Xre/MbcA/ParS toxin-binding domain-containing protein [Thiohalorhabdus sp. Cl-TMA]|uniref:Antitoxin Xre/MbcA/ParS toxin-binding domain-containing protein n=1 Tax=Thiohalorhabdus methylotrophus TaxID=3242694 RepID=A0ABV4U1V5_9GAMM